MPHKKRKFVFEKNKQSRAHVERAKKRRARQYKNGAEMTCHDQLSHCQAMNDNDTNCDNLPQSTSSRSGVNGATSYDYQHNTFFKGFDVPPLKPSIRTLSLFDGIATALLVLMKLGLHIDKYFSCEVDKDAIEVVRENFGDKPVMLGSVLCLDDKKLNELGKIHLLIGGSPCDQLSLVNPARKGFNDPASSATLFFEYVRIRDWLCAKASQEGDQFLWVFENTANMEIQNKQLISRRLGCQPIELNAAVDVPAERRRCFWPNISSSVVAMGHPQDQSPILQDILPFHRWANVPKVATITTNSSAQRYGKEKRYPVQQAGEDTPLNICEVEKLLGFPKSYTDAANLSISRRRKLLGKSFCVPTVARILQPLTEHFWQWVPQHCVFNHERFFRNSNSTT